MTPVTQHAVALARAGNWHLLDALELVARRKDEPQLAGIIHVVGDVPLLGYLGEGEGEEYADCPECGGNGDIPVTGDSGRRERYTQCPWCDGSGEADLDELETLPWTPGDVRTWRELSGEPRDFEAGYLSMGRAGWLSVADAVACTGEYARLVEALRR